MSKLNYQDFIHDLDLEAFYRAIEFVPTMTVHNNDIGHCLFPDRHTHGDLTGKFAIHRDKKVYNCFKCGGGSLLSLTMELFGFTSEEATHWLYGFVNTHSQTDQEFSEYLLDMLQQTKIRAKTETTLPWFNERVLDQFKDTTDYFERRGISSKVVSLYSLKYAKEAVKTAPFKNSLDGKKAKIDEDYVGPAIILPHFWQQRLVGWQSRWTQFPNTPKWLPKYTNTTSFPKAYTLFNYDWALTQSDRVIVCESVPTVLFLRSLDIPAVAYFGDVPSQEQLKLLRRFRQGVILAPDNDHNGDRLLQTATSYLEPYLDVWHLPKLGASHADLGDLAQTDNPAQAVKDHLSLMQPSYLFDSQWYNK